MKRNKFSLSHYVLSTLKFGYLYPITWFEALPADSIRHRTNLLLRMTPLTAPVMHPVRIRVHNWFVPYRLIWDDWENFITGGSDGKFETQPPTHTVDTITQGSIQDHMGLPPGDYTGNQLAYSMLPFRAYNLIYNEHYRDEDLIEEVPIATNSGSDLVTSQQLQRVSWEKDYFTSARPWTSKGDDILIPIGESSPVVSNNEPFQVYSSALGYGDQRNLEYDGSGNLSITGAAPAGVDTLRHGTETGLLADLQNATGISVNDLRNLLAQQRYQEARARFGSRYSEYLKYIAPGIGNLDARLQEPEYLGGGQSMISFSEILQTQSTDTGETPLGTMGGHAISAMRTRRYTRFIPEHGIIMTLLSIVPKAIYSQQVERKWNRLNKEMYFQKELQFIGEQAITNREVYSLHSAPQQVFGYQMRHDDYRYIPSRIAGEMRNEADNWHYARIHAADVGLNKSFIECNPANRPSADQTGDEVYLMSNHSIQARRILAKWPTPRTF